MKRSIYASVVVIFLAITILSVLGIIDEFDKRMEILLVVSFLISISDFSNNGFIIAVLCVKSMRLRQSSNRTAFAADQICKLYEANNVLADSDSERSFKKEFYDSLHNEQDRLDSLDKTYKFYTRRQDTIFGNYVICVAIVSALALIFMDVLNKIISHYNEQISLLPIALFFINSYFHSKYHDFSDKYESTIFERQANIKASRERFDVATIRLTKLKNKYKMQVLDSNTMT